MSVTRPPVAGISVAIATLDRPAGLARCLDALLAGDVLPAEVLIVDQSRDAATEVLLAARVAAPVPLVYMRQPRRGLSASRNAALARATCPVLAMTDDDCIPDRGWVAALDRAFAGPDAPAAVSGRVLPYGPPAPGLHSVSVRESTRRVDYRGDALPWVVGTGGNCAVQCAWFARVGPFDERLGAGSGGRAAEDADLFYRLLRAGGVVRYEPDAVIYHERQSKDRRLASSWGYGHGIGALCGIWLRRRDRQALRLLRRWLLNQSWVLAGALRRGHWWPAYLRLLSLRGTARGLLYGLRVPREGSF